MQDFLNVTIIKPPNNKMKPKHIGRLFAALLTLSMIIAIFAFTTHHDDYEPVLMMREDMEAAVQMRETREIENPGKIWVYDQYIFIIEQYKGIHVLDNTNPENPNNLSFIQVDGCSDVAVNNGLIYANNAVDLIGIKPSPDFQSMTVASRNRNVLPELSNPMQWSNRDFEKNRPHNSIIVRWEPFNHE
ncbi:MAG: hypothetical protein ACQ9MH_27075 [Nitrospinales bacterium]